jgi:hypothetical protein
MVVSYDRETVCPEVLAALPNVFIGQIKKKRPVGETIRQSTKRSQVTTTDISNLDRF